MNGFRETPAGGPAVRTDIVEVFVARPAATGWSFLQLHRSVEPMAGTWQPVIGHVESGETAIACAARELREETGLDAWSDQSQGFFALERARPFYIAQIDSIVMGPRFLCIAGPDWEPATNEEHDSYRWVQSRSNFFWAGQQDAIEEALRGVLDEHSPLGERLRITGPAS